MAEVLVKYDGLTAKSHRMDMRQFGHALVGFDHIITHGLIALSEQRMLRRRERLEFDVVASSPREGSVEALGALYSAYQGTQGNLPFLIQIINDKMPDLLWHWVSHVFNILGGRVKEADPHFQKLMEFTEKMHGLEVADREKQREFLLNVLDKIQPYAASMARPVGDQSDDLALVSADRTKTTTIDVAMAAAVRSKEKLVVGDKKVMQLRIDGITKHTNRASVEFPEELGKYVPAEIRDPIFETAENPYIDALKTDDLIRVEARPSYKGEALHRIYIMGLVSS